jgi:hypothetical protein
MTTELATRDNPLAQLEQVVVEGNLAKLTEGDRVAYYARVCESLGINPLTRPFEYITLNGKLTLYARKDATDQLRRIRGIAIVDVKRETRADLEIVTAYARDRAGNEDVAIGAVSVKGLAGEALANALMKAETKAKRRVTLSLAGLGWLDEVEATDARTVEVAPRASLSASIASRTAALESAAIEHPAGQTMDEHGITSPAQPSVGQPVPPEPTPDDGGARSTSTRSATRARGRRDVRSTPKSLSPGDDGYGSARAHAAAAERGLDHDALRRIALDVLSQPQLAAYDPREAAEFSLKFVTEDEWPLIIAAVTEAPVTTDPIEADAFAAHAAVTAGIVEDVNGDWFSESETIIGKPAGDLTVAEVLEYGIRITARNPLP